MRRAPILSVAAVLAASACSDSARAPMPPAATVHLSSANPDANAPLVAAFFRRTCLEAGGDAAAFAAALQSSGWGNEQVQVASEAMPIAAWRLDRGEIVHSTYSAGAGSSFVDCQLALDAAVSPSVQRIRDALRPLLREPALREIANGPNRVKWQWRPGEREERDVTIAIAPAGAGGRTAGGRGLSIHFGASVVALLPEPAGNGNVQ